MRYAEGMKTASRLRYLLVLVLIPLTGCFSTADPPAFTLEQVSIGAVSDEAVQIICHARLTNPNEIELPLVETRYTVALDDERVYQGRHAIARTLMPAADIMVEIPAVVPRADVETLSGLETMLRIRGKLDYITPGAFAEAMFDIGVRRPSVAYAWDRRVQFDDDAGVTSPDFE
jgi:LEA14-like dessication related protein